MDEPGFGKAAPAEEKRALFRIDGVKLRFIPIAIAVVLGFGLPALGSMAVWIVEHFIPLPDLPLYPWMEQYYESAAQLVLTIVAIGMFKGVMRADFGLHAPRGESYIGTALFWGLVLGVLMTGVEYWREVMIQRQPSGAFELTPVNIAGALSFQGFFRGLSDETLYRALLVTYLAAMIPGRIFFLRKEMSAGAVLIALIFALPFLGGFIGHPPGIAFARLIVAFLQGVFFAYWFEKSRSIVAPVIGHGACFGISQLLVFAMVAFWI
jgi:hypothetical protein